MPPIEDEMLQLQLMHDTSQVFSLPETPSYAASRRNSGLVARRRASSSIEALASEERLKLALLGSPKVGKTAIVRQYLNSTFPEEYKPTLDRTDWIEYQMPQTVERHHAAADHRKAPSEKNFCLEILDAAGSNEFLAMKKLYMEKCQAFMLVYAVNDKSSFEEVKQLRHEIQEKNPHATCMIVANKIDLLDEFTTHPTFSPAQQRCVERDADSSKPKVPRVVPKEEACEFALKTDSIYREITARHNASVTKIFASLLEKSRSHDIGVVALSDKNRRRQSLPGGLTKPALSKRSSISDRPASNGILSKFNLKKNRYATSTSAQDVIPDEKKERRSRSCVIS